MVVDLTGIATATIAGIFGILGIVLPMIIQAKIKNQQMVELLQASVANSLGKIQQATEVQIQAAKFLHPELPPALALGVQYVADHAPEALEHFGITPEAVADKIEAQLGLAEIATNLAASGSSTTSTVPPLAEIPAAPVTAKDLNLAELSRLTAQGSHP
jgi:hypothetical protein